MDLNKLMQQAQQMQSRLQQIQDELANQTVTATSGGGMVTATADGKGQIRQIRIDKTVVDPGDVEMLEDLILAAFQDAKGKAEVAVQSKMQEITGGLPLPPGMKLF